jgi:hypothetical protein
MLSPYQIDTSLITTAFKAQNALTKDMVPDKGLKQNPTMVIAPGSTADTGQLGSMPGWRALTIKSGWVKKNKIIL